ncbi:MAG: FHA domain-containing protein [Acidobacteria bacterium ACB2]|nr:FHA domain-containing protein [Acidobacteria bacterium ACB2]
MPDVEDPDEARARGVAGDGGLAPEAAQRRLGDAVGAEDLERHRPSQLAVDHRVDDCRAPRPQDRADLVPRPDLGAGGEEAYGGRRLAPAADRGRLARLLHRGGRNCTVRPAGARAGVRNAASSSHNPPVLALVVRYGEETLRFPVPRANARLGSDPGADLVVPFSGVSRSHAVVEPRPDGVHLVDTGSKNGLSVSGRRVPECRVSVGDVVRLGRAWLSLEECDAADVEAGVVLGAERSGPGRRRTPKETDSGSGGSKSGASRSAAFRLVRDVDRLDPALVSDDVRVGPILDRAREALGASVVALYRDEGAGRATPLVVSAAPIARGGVDSLLSEANRPGIAGGDRSVELRRHSTYGLGLLAAFGAGPKKPGWTGELLDFLADRLLGSGRAAPPPVLSASRPESRLVLPPGMIAGSSAAMRGLMAQIAATVKSRMDVLLLGETGTGKELFARLIHASGPSPAGPFVAINCAAIPGELLEAELFGVHGRVATGVDPRIGRIQQAEGGTVFLDEIGELAAPLQAKLLRFLQEREILPLGAPAPRSVNIRVISASNRDLPALVREGSFRADLFFRLSGLQFHVPPLRDRREDVPDLVRAIVQKAAEEEGKDVRGVNRRALDLLAGHDWPGNVRELENELRRAVLLCPDGGLVQAEHLGRLRWAAERATAEPEPEAPIAVPEPERAVTDTAGPLRDRVRELEREAAADALRRTGGNKTRAAEILGITRPGLIQMLRRLGLDGTGDRRHPRDAE